MGHTGLSTSLRSLSDDERDPTDRVRHLLMQGVGPVIADPSGCTIADHADETGHREISELSGSAP